MTALNSFQREHWLALSSCFKAIKLKKKTCFDIEASESSFVNACTVITGIMALKFLLSDM